MLMKVLSSIQQGVKAFMREEGTRRVIFHQVFLGRKKSFYVSFYYKVVDVFSFTCSDLL